MPDQSNVQLYPLEERLRLIETWLAVGTWSWDRQSGNVVWSAGMFRLLGLDAGSVLPGLSLFESLAHPADRLPLTDAESLATDGRQRDRRLRIIRPDGELRWIWSLAKTVFDRAGKVRGVMAVAMDITEVEELRRGMQSAQAFDNLIAGLLGVDFWKADDEGNLLQATSWTPKGRHVLPGELSTEGWRALVPREDQEAIAEAWQAAVAARREYAITHAINLEGARQFVHIRGVPFDDPATSESRWVGVATLRPGILDPDREEPLEPEALEAPLIRAARAYLDWSSDELADRAGISLSTVRRVEGSGDPRSRISSTRAVFAAFAEAGIAFRRDGTGRPHFVDLRRG